MLDTNPPKPPSFLIPKTMFVGGDGDGGTNP